MAKVSGEPIRGAFVVIGISFFILALAQFTRQPARGLHRADAGKTTYYGLYRVSTRGEKGPW